MNTTSIEFMALHEDENKMYSHYEIDDMDKDGVYFWSDVLKGTNSWTAMQLTALRSINDEPIYNHMIVKGTRWDIYYVVDMFDYQLMYNLSNSDLEIVGNRFQHPELLELCK